jgi:hypothetical protein
MDNDKNLNFDPAPPSKEGEFAGESASRARNRTVMLTPEITGQVRARLAQEIEPSGGAASRDNGFESVAARPAGYNPPPAVESRGRADVRTEGGFTAPPARAAANAAPVPSGSARKDSGIVWSKETPVVGFMVSFDANPNGDIFVLRSGRVMVSSERGSGENCLCIEDPTVSPMHAILRITAAGEIQILDQLSEFGTRIRRFGSNEEEQLSGDKSSLEHGDVVKFGDRSFHLCVVAVDRSE